MIDPELIPIVAERFKALSDPGRLAVLTALFDGESSVGELAAATGRRQPNVSQMLARLAQARLVAARREGNRVLYRIADPHLERICASVCRSVAPPAPRAQREPRRPRG
jgi:DNA-binding transcriptional ArsR family regulator